MGRGRRFFFFLGLSFCVVFFYTYLFLGLVFCLLSYLLGRGRVGSESCVCCHVWKRYMQEVGGAFFLFSVDLFSFFRWVIWIWILVWFGLVGED